MKKIKVIPIRLIQENHDTDWDGVPNRIDCQPFNPRRHGGKWYECPECGYRFSRSQIDPTHRSSLRYIFCPKCKYIQRKTEYGKTKPFIEIKGPSARIKKEDFKRFRRE